MKRYFPALFIALGMLMAINQGVTLVLYVSEKGVPRGSDVFMPMDIPLYLLLLLKRSAPLPKKLGGSIYLARSLAFIFLLFTLVGEFIAVDKGDFRFAYVHLIRAVLLYYCVMTRLATRKECRSFAVGLMMGLGFQALIGFWQWQIGPVVLPFFQISNYWRAEGTIGTANAFGAFIISLLPLAFRMSMFIHLKFKPAWWALTVISAGALLASFSRGSWVSFGIAMSLFALVDFKKKVLTSKQTALFIAVALIGIVALNVKYGDVISHRFSGAERSISGREKHSRVNLAKDALRVISGREMFGVGLNNYRHYSDEQIAGTRIVHNAYLLITAEQGVFAAVLYLLLIGLAFLFGYQLLQVRDPFYYHLTAGSLTGLLALVMYNMGAPDYRLLPVLLQQWRALALPIGLYVAFHNEMHLLRNKRLLAERIRTMKKDGQSGATSGLANTARLRPGIQ
ncbi:MAG TPA: O-antigen ligase family protein [bacterium]|nr:O-antigen ligase family protein [bacterium]